MEIISVTENAVKKFKEVKGKALGFSIGVLGGGCAGLQYDIKKVETIPENEQIQIIGEVSFYIHPMVIPYIKGLTIDYSDDLMNGGFRFLNPNAGNSCGCGTSFGI